MQTRKGWSLYLLALAACLIYGLTSGFRANYGIMLNGLVDYSGLSYSSVSLVMAIGQLVVGLVQPLFGTLAMKRTNSLVLMIGLFMVMSGLGLMTVSHSFVLLFIRLGCLVSGGLGLWHLGLSWERSRLSSGPRSLP
ncbi:hypothetical protein ACVR05_01190 [Streptococcus caprae]|uniref:MFS transporter n=1 Tax=Streptococcus caprae TaxID=1640501 RepID=A0ABV8CUL4_9STRE